MPSGVFKPYAGVSTAVLIFTKGGSTEKVWFYDMQTDGFSLDDKRTPLDRKGDIPDIVERFRKRREENPTDRKGKCSYVPATESKLIIKIFQSLDTKRSNMKKSGTKNLSL